MGGSVESFVLACAPVRVPRLLPELFVALCYAGARRRVALVVIVVKTRLLLLAPAAFGGERVADALDPVRVAVPADVDAGQVAHLARPPRPADIDMHLVDLRRGRAFDSPLLRLALARREHAFSAQAGSHPPSPPPPP